MNSDLVKIRKICQEMIDTRSRMVANGSAKDYAEYQKAVGQISGLGSAINEINDLLEKKRTDDD